MATASEPWHARSASDVLAALTTTADGLDDAEAARRLAVSGPNALPEAPPRSLLSRFMAQLDNLLIYVLLGAATITLLLGELVDTSVILLVVVINAIFGVVQEGKAEAALAAIRAMIGPEATVVRAGLRRKVPAIDLTPGDVVLLDAGDRVTADLRLIAQRGLRIDEAALTGESVPVDKLPDAVPADAPLAERASMAYSGTLVTAGQGTGVVVATGRSTELGRITTMLGEIGETTTPLIRQMNAFARQLSIAILLLSAVTFAFAVLVRSYSTSDAFLAVVGMAVAAIPEGLPAVMTITLAIGVERMSRRNAIIRKLPAVETLGSVSVICTDKTGTLTRNEMTAAHVVTANGMYAVRSEEPADAGFARTLDVGLLCNDARVALRGGMTAFEGDPMEGALVALASSLGRDVAAARGAFARRDVIPFDAAHRFMATLNAAKEDPAALLLVKGAPEDLLARATHEMHADGSILPLDRTAWENRIEVLAAEGERTLAFAIKELPGSTTQLAHDDVDALTITGLVGLIDPPREEAMRAVADCTAAGISVKMITGDHGLTAAAIARKLNLTHADRCASGRDVDAADDHEIVDLAQRAAVFPRAAPEHKLKLVSALQRGGAIVAMTGDGVNDAPALKAADVGVAMGAKGTEAAKEASEMVLADDNFASIVAAIREGRTVYDNLTKVIAWTLPTSFGETLVVVAAILGGFLLPVTPVQILWINMVTAVSLGLVLAFEPAEDDVMQRPPRPANSSLLTPLLAWQIAFVSVLFVAGAFFMFWWARSRGIDVETARTMVVNTIVVFELFYLFAIRYARSGSITLQGVRGTPAVLIGVGATVVAQLALTYLPPLQALFGTRPVALSDGAVIVGSGVALLAVLEAEKAARRYVIARRGQTGA
ncbi:MAG: HAD-IC family P-type ATPase [Hyphomicrobiaceae bacterium]